MNRRGFALIAVLWSMVALSSLVGGIVVLAREGRDAGTNRVALMRGRWAGEACEAIYRARFAGKAARSVPDTVDLGQRVWCVIRLEDPQSKINLNTASAETLRGALQSDSLTEALLDWRDADTLTRRYGAERSWYLSEYRRVPRDGGFASVQELHQVRGFERIAPNRLLGLFTVAGSGRVNLNTAPERVLRAFSVLDPGAMDQLRQGRAEGRVFHSVDEFLAALDPASRSRLTLHGQELVTLFTFESDRLLLRIAGGVAGLRAVARTTVEVVISGSRLAVVSRVLE